MSVSLHSLLKPTLLALSILAVAGPGIAVAQVSSESGAKPAAVAFDLATTNPMFLQWRYVEVLADAMDAVRLNPGDYRAHYYAAMAQFALREFDAAARSAALAFDRAPENFRPQVQKLQGQIQSVNNDVKALAEARAALTDGLAGKAAQRFEQTWDEGRNSATYGLKAADIYANKLNQTVNAARILRSIRSRNDDAASQQQAGVELEKLAPALRTIAEQQLRAAVREPWDRAAPLIAAAEAADPSYAEVHRVRARLAAATGSAELTQDAIKQLSKRNLLTSKLLINLPLMKRMLSDTGFSQFLTDAVGSTEAAQIAAQVTPAAKITLINGFAQSGLIEIYPVLRGEAAAEKRAADAKLLQTMEAKSVCQTDLIMKPVVSDDKNNKPTRFSIDWRKISKIKTDAGFIFIEDLKAVLLPVKIIASDKIELSDIESAMMTIQSECALEQSRKR